MNLDALQLNISSGMVAAGRHWRRICQATLAGYGISEACAVPLLLIVRLGDGVHQVKVAQAAGLESPSLVRLLDQLCSAGFVCRSEDPLDRRAKALSLTTSGRALAEAIEGELVRLRRVLQLSRSLVAQLDHVLAQLACSSGRRHPGGRSTNR